MTENRKAPKLRFKGFTDAWEQRKLGEMSSLITKGTTPLDKSNTGNVNFVKIESIDEASGEITITKKITNEEHEGYLRRSQLKENDILFSIAGTLGRVTSVKSSILPANTNQALAIIRRKSGDLQYVKTYLKGKVVSDYIKKNPTIGAQPNLSLEQVGNLEIALPILDEQKKIGKYFSELDNLITLHQRKLDRLKNIKKSMLDKMFPKDGEVVPEIRFKGFTDAWEQRKLGDVGTTYTGLSGKAKEDFGHGNGKFITYMNVFSNSVASSEMTEPVEIDDRQNKVISGDVLFTTSSETPEEVGMSSVWLEKSENTYLNSFCFGYRPSIVFEPYYLAYMFRSSSVRKKITFLAQGISRYNISKNKMMNIEIFVPTMSEQQQVGEYFRKLDHLITLHQRKLDKLKNIKKSMLDNMFV